MKNRAIKFYGYLPYAEMMSVAKGCDIAVNAIHSHAISRLPTNFPTTWHCKNPC